MWLAEHRISAIILPKDVNMLKLPISFRRALFTFAIGICLGPMATAAQPREIGTGKQLFIDEEILQSVADAEFTLNPARRAERVLHATDPWATAGLGFVNVIRDGDQFCMWYEVWSYVEKIPGHWMSRLCYAVSRDGNICARTLSAACRSG